MPRMNSQGSNPAIVVTGASTGIGAATALELDRRGYLVFAGVRSEEAGARVKSMSSGRITPLLLDVTNGEQIAAAAAKVRETTGSAGLGSLVNNAGIAVSSPLEIIPLAEFRRQMEVNVVGQLAVIQAFIPSLRIGRGRIVNVTSINGSLATPFLGPYAASKFAFEAMSDALRIELRRWGIKVIVVAPGAIQTPIWEKSSTIAEQMAAGVSEEGARLYEADLNAWRDVVREVARTADPVEKVVEKIVLALTTPRPRARYYLKFSQRFLCRGFRVAPESIRDWLVRRAMKLP
jgi:NAD(P)-dependent dehydrogenase (short-subunit alcohol dehydrogenase family)